jgi:hypothetical protein
MGVGTDPARDIWAPLGVVALGLLPFVVFVGTTSSTTVNGEVVRHEELNVAGLVMAIAGLILAFRVVRHPGGNRIVRSGIAGAGALLCVVQLPLSVDLFSDDEPVAPSDERGELSDADARIARNQIANNDRATAYGVIRLGLQGIVTDTRAHMAYAENCHGGDHKLDIADVPDYPDFIRPDDVTTIEADFDQAYPQGFSVACDDEQTAYYMRELVDDIEHHRAMLEIEVDTYREVHGNIPP